MRAERRPKITKRLGATVASTRFAVEALGSLFKDVPENPSVKHRPFVKELASTPVPEGARINMADELPNKFMSIIEERGIQVPISTDSKKPYWLNGQKYRIGEAIGTAVQYFDQHGAPLPETTLPPVEHVERFINTVIQAPEPLTLDEQFSALLDITDNNVVGAANLGMLANRHMSRFGDQRAYPDLTIDRVTYAPGTPNEEIYELMRKFDEKTARFEVKYDLDKYDCRRDATGDTYYFWTHFFAATMFGSEGATSKAFKKGNELMIFARDKIGNRGGIVAPHSLASQVGRTIGLSLAEGVSSGHRS